MLGNMLNDLAEAIRRWTEKNQVRPAERQRAPTTKKMIILEDEKSQVHLVCQALQIALLEDANMDASHLSADIELDGR